MARRIARKSNKTSHVLNLLTDPKSSEPSAEYTNEIPDPVEPAPVGDTAPSEAIELLDATPDTVLETAPDMTSDTALESAPTKPRRHSSQKPSSAPAQPSVDLSQALEERISQQIHDSLSAQLAEDEAKEAERAEEDRKIAERIAAEMGASAEAEPSTPDTKEEAEDDSDSAGVPDPEQQADVQKKPKSEYDFELVNVMEVILDQFQTEFMEKFGMCTCRHCWLDTRALTLSSLSGKYVVLERDSIGPMLNFYDHRYRGMIMAQLTQACIAVMANPHH